MNQILQFVVHRILRKYVCMYVERCLHMNSHNACSENKLGFSKYVLGLVYTV